MSASTHDLRAALESSLSDRFGAARRVTRFERSPCIFSSSFTLDELEVGLDDGTALELIFKDLGGNGLSERARDAKPGFLYDPVREIETYRSILATEELGTAAYYGSVVDPARDRYWLFIEKVSGVALWQIGELDVWEQVARWAATLHSRFAGTDTPATERLVRYDADLYRTWLRRAVDFADRWEARRPGKARSTIEWLAERYDSVVERLAGLPVTFIHGELYASNVLVAQQDGQPRVCPIDWEVAALGPGLIDLAALVMGWGRLERATLAAAYRETHGGGEGQESFLEALDCARLHLAVQWLGWAPDWRPPRSHRRDWVAEAQAIAEELDL